MRTALLTLVLAVLALSACADDGPDAALSAALGSPSAVRVEIGRSRFSEVELVVTDGTTVRFVNNDAFAHTVTARDDAPLPSDSGELLQGDTFEITVDRRVPLLLPDPPDDACHGGRDLSAACHLSLVPVDLAGSTGVDPASCAAQLRATMTDVVRRRAVYSDAPPVDPVVDAIRRAGLCDDAAFAEFYDHVSAVVYGTVLRVVRDPAMSEEVTQEVFVELWRLAPRFDAERGSPQSWAATVAHRRAVDRVRSEQSTRNREQAESRKAERPRDDVVDEVVQRLEGSQVVQALGQLTDAQREAVTLAYYGGHTYREVAVLLGVPEGSIKTRIRDALIKLRDQMGVAS